MQFTCECVCIHVQINPLDASNEFDAFNSFCFILIQLNFFSFFQDNNAKHCIRQNL